MYLEFYKLNRKPFQISTNPEFLWLGEKHREALAVLKYGVLDNKGFLLLTGDVGTGKTTLLNALTESLGNDVLVAMVTDPGLAKMDFFNFIADSFAMNRKFRTKGEFLIKLKQFLLDVHAQGRQTLLIIDECQNLNQKMLEEVRLLSNIELHNSKLINIFFVGQSEFNDIIVRPRNRAIRQRITINYNISALSAAETENYIQFRLKVAGSQEPIFSPQAIEAIYRFSNGYPRLINIVCDQALLTGYVQERQTIGEKIIDECAKDLRIPYGAAIPKSLATPEAGDIVPLEQPLAVVEPAAPPPPHPDALIDKISRSRALTIALIAILVLWIGLAIYLVVNHNRPGAAVLSQSGSEGMAWSASQRDSERTTQEAKRTAGDPAAGTPAWGGSDAKTNESDGAEAQAGVDAAALDKQAAAIPVSAEGESPVVAPQPSNGLPGDSQPAALVSLEAIQAQFGQNPEVRFGFNSNTLEEAAYEMLGQVAQYSVQNPEAAIVLKGFTDSSGAQAYNQILSEFRANMVKSYLVGRGVQETTIKVLAMGPQPAAQGVSAAGSQRKVVIEIIPPP